MPIQKEHLLVSLGSNSVHSYSLEGRNVDDFDIDFSSIAIPYLIVRSSLDRQRRASYLLTLIASDHGQQPTARSGSIQLDIRIVDTPVPSFLQSVYSIDVREDVSIGTNLLRVEAASDDGGQILYELVNECPFIIDRLTGQIQLKQLLDFEREDSYRLTVKASENGIPTFAIVFVRVLDINDNSASIYLRVEGKSERRPMPVGDNSDCLQEIRR